MHVAIQGPAVFDVETTFRERWEDSTPLTLNPGRLLSSLAQRRGPMVPRPLAEQAPPPPSPAEAATEAVQILRTYPAILPKGYDFAPAGERSVAHANTTAVAHARRLVYLEDQYLWSEEVGRHFGKALRENPELRLIAVIPMVPDEDGAVTLPPQLYGRKLAMDLLLEAGGDRVAVYGLTSEAGYPIYVHAKVCVIDDVWASVGSDNFNRRSWSSDSEIACAVQDVRVEPTARHRRRGTRSPCGCAASWWPSTSASPPRTCPTTPTRSGTSWRPRPRRWTTGMPVGPPPAAGATCRAPRRRSRAPRCGGGDAPGRGPGRRESSARRVACAGCRRPS